MAFIVVIVNRWVARALETWGAVRVHRAEREIARFLDLLGGSSIDPEVKEQLVADYLANRPLDSRQPIGVSSGDGSPLICSERPHVQWASRASRRSSSRTSLRAV